MKLGAMISVNMRARFCAEPAVAEYTEGDWRVVEKMPPGTVSARADPDRALLRLPEQVARDVAEALNRGRQA
jgi:hypothetical protein